MSHLLYRVYSFECDVPECDTTEDVGPGFTLREARKELQRSGWTRSNGQDVCAYHSGNPGWRGGRYVVPPKSGSSGETYV